MEWLTIILAVTATVVAGFFTIWARQRQVVEKTHYGEARLSTLWDLLRETRERLEALEQGKAAETLGEGTLSKLSERLSAVERALEPLEKRPEFTSPEFHILLYEIERMRQDLDSRQAVFERASSERSSSQRFWIMLAVAAVSLLLTLAIVFS